MEYAIGDFTEEYAVKEILRHYTVGNILDVGCGIGLIGRKLKQALIKLKQGKTLHLDGIDLSPIAIEHAKKTRAYEKLFEGDVNKGIHPDITEEHYDAVVSANCLLMNDRMYPTEASLMGIFQILKPGGHLIICRRVRGAYSLDFIRHQARYNAILHIAKFESVSSQLLDGRFRVLAYRKPK